MEEHNQNQSTQETFDKQVKHKRFNKKKLAGVILLLLVICGLVAFVWYMQQEKINDLSAQKADAVKLEGSTKKELELQKTANIQLSNQIVTLDEKIKSMQNPEQATLSLTVNEAKHNGFTYNELGSDLVYVDISITNTSRTLNGYLSQSDLSLKNKESGTIYPLCQSSPIGYYVCQSGLAFPGGKTELVSQTIPAGEKVRGSVGFYVPKDLTTAELNFSGTSYTLKFQSAQ